ncbi:MAG TPA: LamG-like jellyroll fold domain-containing protein [Phycisphaerae bacterium]|nr:LamG-like jellyroll fold domain-containing protein [Phycisphaerae bacterium]
MIPGERHIEWPDVREVAQRRGRNSRCPDLWRGLAALWLPGWDGLNSHDLLGRYHMTAYNTPTRSVGAIGPCINLVGASTQYLEVDATPIASEPLTLACWARVAVGQSSYVTLSPMWTGDKDAGDQFHAMRLYGKDGVGYKLSADSGWSQAQTASYIGDSGIWLHCVGTFPSSILRHSYMMGGNQATNTTSEAVANLDRITIGRYGDSTPTYPFDGAIAYPACWRRALTDAEVKELADGGYARMLTPRPPMISLYVPSGEEPAATPWLYCRRSARIVA